MPRHRKPASPFRCFNTSPEVIRLVVMMYVKYPLSLRNVEDLLFERACEGSLGNSEKQEIGRWATSGSRTRIFRFDDESERCCGFDE